MLLGRGALFFVLRDRLLLPALAEQEQYVREACDVTMGFERERHMADFELQGEQTFSHEVAEAEAPAFA